MGRAYGELLDLESQFLDLGLVMAFVLLKREIIGLLLPVREHPLLHLLLIPVHLHLVLIHLLVPLENLVLQIVQTLLDLNRAVVQLLELLLDSAILALGHLLQMVLRLDLLVLLVDQRLRVEQLRLHVLEMLGQDLDPLRFLVDFLRELLCEAAFFEDLEN